MQKNDVTIISQYSPLKNKASSEHSSSSYGDVHLQGKRYSQEDGGLFLQWKKPINLKPEQIAHRLWTSLKIIDKYTNNNSLITDGSGSTACIAFINNNHLIAANLADSVLFVAVYDSNGKLINAKRITENLHKPTQEEEKTRIKEAGGYVLNTNNRVQGVLSLARAIGDQYLNEKKDEDIISSDSSVVIYDLNLLKASLAGNSSVSKMQFIVTCDGFTEPADTKKGISHEQYLKECLVGEPGMLKEIDLAKKLANQAINDGSHDNVSVSVLSYDETQKSHCVVIFDGHGGQEVANYAVNNFSDCLNEQLNLSQEQYEKQPLSVKNNQTNFDRDNKNMVKMISLTSSSIKTNNPIEERSTIEAAAQKIAPFTDATEVIFKNKNYIPGNAKHNKEQALERVQFVFANETKQNQFVQFLQSKKIKPVYSGPAATKANVVELAPQDIEPFYNKLSFKKPDREAIYNKFPGVRAGLGAASVMLVKPETNLNEQEIALVQFSPTSNGIQLKLSFRNFDDAEKLKNLLMDLNFLDVKISTSSFTDKEFGNFKSTIYLTDKIDSYVTNICGLNQKDLIFLYRVSGLGGYYCQKNIPLDKINGLETALKDYLKPKTGFFSLFSESISPLEEEAAKLLLQIIASVNSVKETPNCNFSKSIKELYQLIQNGSLGKSLNPYMNMVETLIGVSQINEFSSLVTAPKF